MNRLLRLWSIAMMVLAVLILIAGALQLVASVLLLTGAIPSGTQPGEPARGTLLFQLFLELVFLGVGAWLFRFAYRLRRSLASQNT
jgi:hypothetical protein